ncbi:hypothetical protein [Cryptosporangium sp. NPDC048952]|uniref:hypothetical protein n=1 Tax=Cryptosporangium sp. NPDC048952 TaxID=3363961 RepID=UPI00371CBAD9
MAINELVVYLGSRKNVVGCLGGLVGLALAAFGFGGSWWWVLVVGLYAAGALATPPARAAVALDGESMEPAAIRTDLASVLAHVNAVSGRLPAGAEQRIRETATLLRDVLDRPDALEGAPEQAYAVSRVVRSDLPTSLQTFLARGGTPPAGRARNCSSS